MTEQRSISVTKDDLANILTGLEFLERLYRGERLHASDPSLMTSRKIGRLSDDLLTRWKAAK